MRLSPATLGQPDSPVGAAYDLVGAWSGPPDLLDLGQAAPAYPPAATVVEHVRKVALDAKCAAYLGEAGLPRLRAAFAADLGRDYGGGVDPDDVVITAGCNQAFCVVMSALAQHGDEVVLPLPAYFNHDMWLRMQGVTPVALEPGPDLVPTAAAADELIGPRTRAIVLVTPGNPSGVTLPPNEIAAMAALASRHGIALVLDETYRSFRADLDVAPHELFRDEGWRDTVISLHSFSKDLAIPGYRVGAVVASAAVNREVLKVLDCVAIGAPRIGQEAAWAGLTTAAGWRAARAREVEARRAAFIRAMSRQPSGFEVVSCGAYFAWVRHPFAVPTSSVVRMLAVEHGILTIPGTAFLPDDRGMLRISVSVLDDDRIRDLVCRLESAASAVRTG
jgi:aspartate/methionine/tyrosine aminotransferase